MTEARSRWRNANRTALWISPLKIPFFSLGQRSWRCKSVFLNECSKCNDGPQIILWVCRFLIFGKRSLRWRGWSRKEGAEVGPQEHVQRIDEHIVYVPVPQVLEETAEVDEQIGEVHIPSILEEISKSLNLHHRSNYRRICEQSVDVPVPQVDVQDILVPPIMEEIAGVVQCTPHGVATGEADHFVDRAPWGSSEDSHG